MKEIWDLTVAYATPNALRRYLGSDKHEDWLSPQEHKVLQTFRSVRRKEEWFCGRVLAKQLIRQRFESQQTQQSRCVPNAELARKQLPHICAKALPQSGLDYAQLPTSSPVRLTITSRDGLGRSVRPRVFIAGRLQPWSLSIAHIDDLLMACLSVASNIQIGADLVPATGFDRSFAVAWMTKKEQEWLSKQDSDKTSLVWGIKEAVYKAINVGEPFVPRQIEVFPEPNGGYSCRLCGIRLRGLTIAVDRIDAHVAIMVRCCTQPAYLTRSRKRCHSGNGTNAVNVNPTEFVIDDWCFGIRKCPFCLVGWELNCD